MKTLKKLGFVMFIVLTFANCGSNKNTANNQPQPTNNGRKKIEIPCYQASRSDNNFYRELGIGKSENEQSARDEAIKAAKSMLKNRLGGLIKGISTDYSKNTSGQGSVDVVQREIEQKMSQVVEKMLNDADNPCEEMYLEEDGITYVSYYVIEISKQELIQQTIDVFSEDTRLDFEFNQEQFRRLAEQQMLDRR